MHVEVSEMPKKPSPSKNKKRKIILAVSIIIVLLCLSAGMYMIMVPAEIIPLEPNTTIPEIPHYNTNFSYEIGVIPASYNQHIIKITHKGGETVDDMSKSLWITINPPDSTPYLRRTGVIHISKYLDFRPRDILYIYLGKDERFYASKELPNYADFIDFPNGMWGVNIDDARYKVEISGFEFRIDNSKTHIITSDSNLRISDMINSANAFDTIMIKGDLVYHEQLTITNKPIRLYSLNGAVIDAGGSNSVITVINSSYSEIYGFELINSGTQDSYEAGVTLKYSDYISIRNNTIYNNQNGIYLIGSKNNDMRYNQIYSNDISGIALTQGSNSNTVRENSIQINTMGIYIQGTSDTNYIVRNNGYGNTRYGILIDNKLKNIYEYNNFSYDRMSYDRIVEQNLTTYSVDKTSGDDWLSTCGPHESPSSPACIRIGAK